MDIKLLCLPECFAPREGMLSSVPAGVRSLSVPGDPLPNFRCPWASLAVPQAYALLDNSIVALVVICCPQNCLGKVPLSKRPSVKAECPLRTRIAVRSYMLQSRLLTTADAYIPTSLYALSGQLCDNVPVPGAQLGLPEPEGLRVACTRPLPSFAPTI